MTDPTFRYSSRYCRPRLRCRMRRRRRRHRDVVGESGQPQLFIASVCGGYGELYGNTAPGSTSFQPRGRTTARPRSARARPRSAALHGARLRRRRRLATRTPARASRIRIRRSLRAARACASRAEERSSERRRPSCSARPRAMARAPITRAKGSCAARAGSRRTPRRSVRAEGSLQWASCRATSIPSTQQAYSDQPYPQPFFSTEFYTAKRPVDPISQYQFIPWGGPPAFDPFHNSMGMRSGLSPITVDSFGDPVWLGVGEGITVFDGVKVRSGSYSLRVAVSTINSSGGVSTGSILKTAHLDAAFVLDTIHAPVFMPDQKGGGSCNRFAPRPGNGSTRADRGLRSGQRSGRVEQADEPAAELPGCERHEFRTRILHDSRYGSDGTYKLPDRTGRISLRKGTPKASTSICTAEQNKAAGDADAARRYRRPDDRLRLSGV